MCAVRSFCLSSLGFQCEHLNAVERTVEFGQSIFLLASQMGMSHVVPVSSASSIYIYDYFSGSFSFS